MNIVAVTGLAREAKIVSGTGVSVVTSGGDAKSLPDKIAAAIGPETKGIISIGLAGGLSPVLRVGQTVIAPSVLDGKQRILADWRWTETMERRLPQASFGLVIGSDAVAATPLEKATLRQRTNAVAIDMETHVAARIAQTRGIPFAVLRVISDGADHALPPAATVAMKGDGGIAIGAVIRSLVAQPAQVPLLMETARHARTAFRALFRCRNLLGSGFACPYLG